MPDKDDGCVCSDWSQSYRTKRITGLKFSKHLFYRFNIDCSVVLYQRCLFSLFLRTFMLIQGNVAGSSRTFQFSSAVSENVLSEMLVSALELYRKVTPPVLWAQWGIWGKARVHLSLNSMFFVCV